MASLSTIEPQATPSKSPHYKLTVNAFDRAATMIVSLLVIMGIVVGSLAVIFFANKFSSPVQPIAFVPVEATSPTANQGFAEEPDPPADAEAMELIEPELEDTLDMLSELTLSDELLADEALEKAEKSSQGDARQPGPGNDGVVERVPRWERWKIRFEPRSPSEFARWLDQYGIRVGVLGRDNKVHVAWGFSKGGPQVESKEPKDYNGWGQTIPADGPMPKLTQDLARKAGTMQRGPIALLFYPFEVEALLHTLEGEKNKFKDPNKIRETVFTVVEEGNGFQFVVVDQKYF
jgi:hypothetical protein